MKAHRITAVIALVAIAGVTGCRGEVTAADADDALALDSMLEKQVMTAQGDSVPVIEEVQEVIRPLGPAPRATAGATASSTEPPAPVRTAPAPPAARSVAPPARQPEVRVAERPPAVPSATERKSESETTAGRSTPLRSVATVPSGTRLSLVSRERVCVTTARVGERIPARTTSRLTGPIGTVVPAGAPATVVVTSLTGPLGEEQILVDVRSISVGGTSYRISSQVTDIELDRRAGAERCIPAGGSITAQLNQPLRITR